MWITKILLFISLFSYLETFAGPKKFNGKVYKHFIESSTDIVPDDLEEEEEEEMLARVEMYLL